MSIVLFSGYPMPSSITIPTSLKNRKFVLGGNGVGYVPLPTDPIGTFTLTLQNLVVGSLWEVETVSVQGTSISSGTATNATTIISLSAYSTGSSNNSMRVKVRNSSASPYYQAFETQTTAVVGSLSIFINQVRDDI